MITYIPNVEFDGSSSYPYSIDFSSGGSDKSQLTLTFIDKNGNYDLENRYKRDSNTPVSVSIGSFFKFTGYIVFSESTQMVRGGAKLEIRLDDSSIVLDKYYIGLKGLQGPGFTTNATGSFSNLILVGKQVDPCENIPPNYSDPCAPDCGEENGGKQSFNCAEEKLIKILEVDYSFPDLEAAVAGVVKFGSFPSGINTSYRANYTGNLRDVLKNWCQDFGIDFYWSDNAVYFVDLTTGTSINDENIESNAIVSKKNSFSIEGNYTQGNIVYFGGEGEKREYSCTRSASKRLVLRPITLYDILDDSNPSSKVGQTGYSFLVRNYDPQTKRLDFAVKQLFESVVLNYYSEILRNMYILFEREGLDSVEKMVEFSKSNSKKPIPSLGGFRPRRVFHSGETGLPVQESIDANIYKTLVERLSPNESVDFINRKGYFIAAKYNESQHDYFNNFEKKLGEEFLGKYWIRGGVEGSGYSFSAPDGSPTYYSNASEIQFPFLDALPSDIQKSSDFIETLVGVYDPTQPDKTHGRFLIMERSAAWVPNQTADSIQKLIQELEPFSMKVIGSEDVNGQNILQAGEVFFAVFPRPKGLDLDISNRTKEAKNPYDAKNVGLKGELGGILSTFGLVSSVTQTYTIKSPTSYVQIFLPSQAGPYVSTQYPGYVVFANGQQFSNEIVKILPKSQNVLGSVPKPSDKDVGIQVQYRDITQNIVDLFTSNGTTCGYDTNKITTLLRNFNSRYSSPASVEREIRTYEISGIPEKKYAVKDGLQSFSLNYSDDGLSTTLVFSNLPRVSKSEAVILEEFKKTNTIMKKAIKYFKQNNNS